MKKLSTIYLLGALVTLSSCAREYPVFNQMPRNAYIGQPNRSEVKAQAPAEVAVVTPAAPNATEVESVPVSEVIAEGRVSEVLEKNTPKQIDEQLESALATTQGQKLMAKPAIAAQINKVRAMMAKPEMQNATPSDVQVTKASKLIDKSVKKSMEPAAAKALNRNLKLGLILVGVGIILSVIPGVWYLGGIVGLIGVIFIIIGLLEM
ncbi:hypothetical protein [Salmonirosea aquatica]|uniref:Uncharacterized protein n=1 Tax=Salmonirosea aquatica TaxID=2654236 RepID=A0A7C9FPF8_9BACT|nr:hypothetical protein [Cytophagaceae bacterium SJW1-29]